jgi:hypothetical protein
MHLDNIIGIRADVFGLGTLKEALHIITNFAMVL